MAEDSPAGDGTTRKGMFGLVAVIGSALIGLNTLVTSCASETLTTNAAQLHAAEEDERFWTDAIKELSEISGERAKPDGNFQARCRFLAGRTAPFIAEFISEKADAKSAAGEQGKTVEAKDKSLPETVELVKRVELLREEFRRYIVDEQVTSADCRLAFEQALERAQSDQAEKAARAKALAENHAPPAESHGSDQKPLPPRDPLIALSPISDTGWDVDVFWCENDKDEAATAKNFGRAYRFGTELAGYALSHRRLDSNQIGRVRVRRLAEVLWNGATEFSSLAGGEFVRFGPAEKGETELADALTRMNPEYALQKQPASATRTRWYVSTYFCAASVGTGSADSSIAADASALAL